MQVLTMDRTLVEVSWEVHSKGKNFKFGSYEDIFVGHTPTQAFDSEVPLHLGNIWLMDTGAGWTGKLSIMDVETKEFWQSDPVTDLYGDVAGRSLK